MSNGYVIYPDSVGRHLLSAEKKYARTRSKNEPGEEFRVESVDTGKTVARFRNGSLTASNPSKRKTRKRVAKGGRAVHVRNFTGTIRKKSNEQVVIEGTGRKQ